MGPGPTEQRLRHLGLMVLALCACLRLAYLLQYLPLPFIDGPLFDAEVYLAQARAIREGRFGDPTLLAFSPLYGYLLALVHGQAHPLLVVLLQFGMGVVTLWLVYRTLLDLYGPLAALFAAALWGGYGWIAFFETKLLSETLGMLLLVIAVRLYSGQAVRRGAAIASVAAGATFALATLARANLIFSLPLVVVGAALMPPIADGGGRTRLRRLAWVALGVGLIVGGNGLWTRKHSGLFVPVILVSKTAGTSSRTAWDGDLSKIAADDSAPPSSWDVVRQAHLRLAGAPAGASEPEDTSLPFGVDVLGWLRNTPARLWATFRNVETTHQYRYYGERANLSALNLFPVTFGFLCLCAVLGCFALYRDRRMSLLYALAPVALGTLVTTTLVMPSARYRMPIVVPLVVLGGIGLAWLARASFRFAGAARVGTLLAGLWLAASTMTYELRSPGMWHVVLAEAAMSAKRPKEARAHLQTALERYGDDPAVRARVELQARSFRRRVNR